MHEDVSELDKTEVQFSFPGRPFIQNIISEDKVTGHIIDQQGVLKTNITHFHPETCIINHSL